VISISDKPNKVINNSLVIMGYTPTLNIN